MKNTLQPFCKSKTSARNRTCRWRAVAASSFKPWIRRRPQADGKSPDLELRGASTQLPQHLRLPSTSPTSRSSTPIRRHAESGRGMAFPADPGIRGNGGSRHTIAELQRAPPTKEARTCTKSKPGDPTSSMAPPDEKLTHPTLSTRVKRGSPALPPPKRPPEDGGYGGSTARRWICGRVEKIPSLL